MTVIAADLKLYAAEHVPTNDTDPAGGAVSAVQITPSTIGEFLPALSSNPAGEADKSQCQKCFILNDDQDSPACDFIGAVAFLANGLLDAEDDGTIEVQASSSSDATDMTVRIIGQDADGDPQTEDLALSGSVEPMTGAKTWLAGAGGIQAVLCLDSNTGAKKVLAAGTLSVTRGVALGQIPLGYSSAIGFVTIGLPATLNDTVEIANRLAVPVGISFAKHVTAEDGAAFGNSGTLTAGDYQGIWVVQTAFAGQPNLRDVDLVFGFDGDSD